MTQVTQLRWLGSGTYGTVMQLKAAAPPLPSAFAAAVKWLFLQRPGADADAYDEPAAVTPDEALAEVTLAHLLSTLDAPAFPAFYGALCVLGEPGFGAALDARVRRLAAVGGGGGGGGTEDDTDLTVDGATAVMDGRPLVMMLQGLGDRGTLANVLDLAYRAGAAPVLAPAAARTLLFQLAWSLAVAQIKIGLEHRDLDARNVALATVERPTVEHYLLYAPAGDADPGGAPLWAAPDAWTAELPVGAVRPLLIDFGMSSYYAVPEPPTEWDAPHHDFVALAAHSAPELYFLPHSAPHSASALNRGEAAVVRTEAADQWQLGLLALSVLGARHVAHLAGLPAPAARRNVTGFEVHEYLLYADAVADAVAGALPQLFSNALQLALPAADGLLATREARDEWRAFVDSKGAHQFLAVLAVQAALGQDWWAVGAAAAPDWHAASPWGRLLDAPPVRLFWQRNAWPRLRERYEALVAALAPEERALVASALAWRPRDRLDAEQAGGGGTWRWLQQPYFAPLRVPWEAAGPSAARHVYYQCHATPALRALAPRGSRHSPGDAKHRAYLRDQQQRARQLVMTSQGAVTRLADVEAYWRSVAARLLQLRAPARQ